MKICSQILQCLLFSYMFISLVESDSLTHDFAANDSMGAKSGGDDEKNGTCALLMYGNAVLVHVNLCGNRTIDCPYRGGSFTAWIDVTLEQTLQVWLISGSCPQEAQRPPKPLIEYPNFTLPIGAGENVSLFFRGSSCKNQYRRHEISAWSFNVPSAIDVHVIPFSIRDDSWETPAVGRNAIRGMVATLVILGFISLILALHHKRKVIKDCLGRSVFSFKELSIATKHFSKKELLGRNEFGTVYRGCLERYDNTLVAVKRINFESKYVHKTFHAEILCLSEIQHKNIVDLLGWCQEKCRLLLVYEYMSNGSLHEWIHGNCKCKPPLSWKLRQTILEGIATAIDYLHTKCPLCILHRNIKSSNVMLDHNFVAHLGDFGLGHLLDYPKQYKSTIPQGSLECMAPEMPYTGKATKESDVYSFGILILEVICGRHPLDKEAMEPEELVLLYSCWRAHEAGTLLDMADPILFHNSRPSLRVEPHYEESTDGSSSSGNDCLSNGRSNSAMEDDVQVKMMIIKNLLHLGLLCCMSNPKARPTIGMVLQVLENIGYIDNVDYMITNVSMPSLPDT